MNNFYVYIHRKKSNNEIFYVGKGKGKRAYETYSRNRYWTFTYKKYGHIVEILKDNLSDSTTGRKNHNYDATIRKFKHKDGIIEMCTMNELKVKYSLGCHISSVVHGKFTHHRGWSYLGVV